MPSLDEIIKDPDFDAEASGASRATMSTFILTFLGCFFY